MTTSGLGGVWPPVYTAGTVPVRSTATFENQAGQPTDPGSVSAVVQYGDPNVVPSLPVAPITRSGQGVYFAEIGIGSWAGPGNQQVKVTWTGSGTVNATLFDFFQVQPSPSTVADVLGP